MRPARSVKDYLACRFLSTGGLVERGVRLRFETWMPSSQRLGCGGIRVPMKTIGLSSGLRLVGLTASGRMLLLASHLLLIPVLCQAQFNYSTNNGAITITQYTGSGGTVSIPGTITGLPVTAIGPRTFDKRTDVTYVTIPKSVTHIGDGAFWGCSSLDRVTLPESLISIGVWAFHFCHGLHSIAIPNNVSSIGDSAFGACTNLAVFTVVPENDSFSSADGVLFNKTQTQLVQYPAGKQGAFQIPGSVATIGNMAFTGCSGLTGVAIPDSVTNIGDHAFTGCGSLTGVTLGKNVTRIGSGAFYYCSGLTEITVPSRVNAIGELAFGYCTNLAAIQVDPLNADFSASEGVLFNKTRTALLGYPGGKKGAYAIPDGVITIESRAFDGCSNLTQITIPGSVTTIGSAFYGCKGLTRISIPEGVTTIDRTAFGRCAGLTNVTIASTVTNIGSAAFGFCVNLRAVHFLGNCPTVGRDLFERADNVIVYYQPGAIGWESTLCGRPTALIKP